MNNNVKRFYLSGALVSALLLSFHTLAEININTATGTIDAQFSILNISAYPVSFKYNPQITKGSVGSKWETSLDANLQLSEDVPIYTISAYCSKILFIKNEDGKLESGGGQGAKFEFVNGDYVLTSNIGEKLTFDESGNLKTIQDESGSTSIIARNTKNLLAGWETKSERIQTISIDNALSGSSPISNDNSKVERNTAGQIVSIKADKQFNFSYKDSVLSGIQVNGITKYYFEYDERGLLSRLQEPDHDYLLSYYEDGRVQSIDDALGDSVYVEYKSDAVQKNNTQFVYVWNLTKFLRTQYKYTPDKVEITEGPIDSEDVLFGTIDRKTGAVATKNINGDNLDIAPGKEGNFVVKSSLRGFTPFQITYSFGNLVLKNKNGSEYFKDLISPSEFALEKTRSEIKDGGIIRDINKNVIELISGGICMMKYSYSKDGSSLQKAVTASGDEFNYTYDKEGRMIQIVDSLGNKTSFRYGKNTVEIIYPNATKTILTLSEEGLPIKISDPMKRKTLVAYQNARLPQKVELCNFDTQTYIGSQENDLYSIQSSLFGLWLFIDNNDQTITRISPSGNVITYETNDKKQITAIKNEKNINIANYVYNKYSQVTEASTDSCRIKFDYDDYGRLSQKSYDKELSLAFEYDKKDIIKTLADSEGFSIKYIRDAGGKLTSIISDKTGTFKVSYYDSGMIKEIYYPNGVVLKWTYDVEPKIIEYSILLPGGASKTTKLGYDKIGNITRINNGQTTVNFFYDELNHLTKVADSGGKEVNLSFDVWGNLLKLGKNESKLSSPSIFSQINSLTLSYNNEISSLSSYEDADNKRSVSYDWNNRLTSLKFNNGNYISLDYAPMEDEIDSVTANGIRTKYFFYGTQLYATKDTTSKKSTKFIYVPDTNICLAVIRPDGEIQYPLCDVFGSITDLTDKKGRLTDSRTFNSIGLINSSDTLNIPTAYGGLLSLDKGSIVFTENGPVLLKIMRAFGPKAQDPGDISLDFSNKLSFMESMPLTTLNENSAKQNLGINNR